MKKLFFISIIFCLLNVNARAQKSSQSFRNAKLPLEIRVDDLLKDLTLKEKISLLGFRNPSVGRLGIPAYNWWNEGLHGVARAGEATVFPQAIGMAASFNNDLLYKVADAISTEARAKYNLAIKKDRHLQYMGLTFWSPNINIFRDPRWGRGQETYGEDPFLTATMGTAFVKGIQGNDKHYIKASACAKHFAVYSGPESERHTFNAIVDEKDLRETYLYAFKKLVDAGVESVMCAYNSVNGEPCCTGHALLKNILRNEWKFKGHVVTDCWALEDVWLRHKALPNSVDVAAAAIKAGVNLDCSNLLQDDVMKAIDQKLLTEKDVDTALAPILRTQFKLGFYDAPASIPFSKYGADSVANAYHTMLSRKMAQQSMVLLKNDNNLLPLDKNKYSAYMVVGPNAASMDALLGNYHGVTGNAVTFVEGITGAVDESTRVEYDKGCNYSDTTHFGGIWAASNADVTIAVIGLTPVYEGEEGDAFLSPGGGDRLSLQLPASQIAFIKALRKGTKTPIVAVITAGSDLDLSSIEPYVDAIIYAWYPGQQGGNALADILFGKVSPSGKLPVTFYKSFDDLPAYDSYAMKGRTYRYFTKPVEYPFGFGLSYTHFDYAWQKEPVDLKNENNSISFEVKISNKGNFDGYDVPEVYIKYPDVQRMPVEELKGFQKVFVEKGKTKTVKFSIPVSELEKWDLQEGKWKLYPGKYQVCIGKNADEMILKKTILIK
ncbi:MAG: glycoside hydrolase family 3 C-terminal domain-containing protein [Bacteroidota bacterium]|nr:glycoside hydrolase family 3 C-terminal domain-containing protein [Bacteroidota bacterium]